MILLAFICGTLWLLWWVYATLTYRPRTLRGATVVVTGACSDVGRRLCLQLYSRGARVLAWDYSRIKLQELQAEVLRATAENVNRGGSARSSNSSNSHNSGTAEGMDSDQFVIMAVDASSRVQVQRAAREVSGPVDLIINAAHTCPGKALHDRADDSVDRVFQTNLVSPLLVVRQLLPLLFAPSASRGGGGGVGGSGAYGGSWWQGRSRRDDYAQVVNIVCGAANYAVAADAPDYAASQWGMVGLHYSMRAWVAKERAVYAAEARNGSNNNNNNNSAFMNSNRGDVASGKPKMSPAGAPASGRGNSPAAGAAREVRMTLLCLNDIQNGIPTALSSMLAPASPMVTSDGKTATTVSNAGSSSSGANAAAGIGGFSPSTATSPDMPDRDEAGSGGHGGAARSARLMSPSREGYTATLQKRNAELDRAVACCMAAICRGEERYCYGGSWYATLVYPVVMICPLPWAERLLRWMQRPSSSADRREA